MHLDSGCKPRLFPLYPSYLHVTYWPEYIHVSLITLRCSKKKSSYTQNTLALSRLLLSIQLCLKSLFLTTLTLYKSNHRMIYSQVYIKKLTWSSMSLHEVSWACMQLLTLSEQLTRISQCLFSFQLRFVPGWINSFEDMLFWERINHARCQFNIKHFSHYTYHHNPFNVSH